MILKDSALLLIVHCNTTNTVCIYMYTGRPLYCKLFKVYVRPLYFDLLGIQRNEPSQ